MSNSKRSANHLTPPSTSVDKKNRLESGDIMDSEDTRAATTPNKGSQMPVPAKSPKSLLSSMKSALSLGPKLNTSSILEKTSRNSTGGTSRLEKIVDECNGEMTGELDIPCSGGFTGSGVGIDDMCMSPEGDRSPSIKTQQPLEIDQVRNLLTECGGTSMEETMVNMFSKVTLMLSQQIAESGNKFTQAINEQSVVMAH